MSRRRFETTQADRHRKLVSSLMCSTSDSKPLRPIGIENAFIKNTLPNSDSKPLRPIGIENSKKSDIELTNIRNHSGRQASKTGSGSKSDADGFETSQADRHRKQEQYLPHDLHHSKPLMPIGIENLGRKRAASPL